MFGWVGSVCFKLFVDWLCFVLDLVLVLVLICCFWFCYGGLCWIGCFACICVTSCLVFGLLALWELGLCGYGMFCGCEMWVWWIRLLLGVVFYGFNSVDYFFICLICLVNRFVFCAIWFGVDGCDLVLWVVYIWLDTLIVGLRFVCLNFGFQFWFCLWIIILLFGVLFGLDCF